ncbi:SRPBCC family protein [Nocardia arizonensis]|uniref:SRPBCC family protein n=1 Tax=Nocardia arizonensis TaxID=1141647 RepID=UPI0006D1A100|nr:SRPBCC family protein [Nocardia arizonensis]
MSTEADGNDGAVEVAITVQASPEDVFDVLSDGWLYPLWVVGASHMREVDDTWPHPGARLHHSVGPWPFTLNDTTEVIDIDAPRSLELHARSWPVGAAWIRIDVRPDPLDSTEIRLSEKVSAGPGRVLPTAVQGLPLIPRNRESLKRLADLVHGRSRRTHDSGSRSNP